MMSVLPAMNELALLVRRPLRPGRRGQDIGHDPESNSASAPSCGRSASIPPPGAIPAARRTPTSTSRRWCSYAQTLERGRFDAFFMADHLAVLNMPMEALKRSATVTSFDPLTLLPALAMHTEHLGLIATASTTFEPAYTIARRFASLDHISRRPRRLEPRDDVQSRRGAEFRHGRADGACRALCPRARVLRCRHRPVGFVGRRRLHPRRRERHLFRSGQAPCAEPQGQVPEGAAGRSTSRGRSRAGR